MNVEHFMSLSGAVGDDAAPIDPTAMQVEIDLMGAAIFGIFSAGYTLLFGYSRSTVIGAGIVGAIAGGVLAHVVYSPVVEMASIGQNHET